MCGIDRIKYYLDILVLFLFCEWVSFAVVELHLQAVLTRSPMQILRSPANPFLTGLLYKIEKGYTR
jgi:hypothetical protein